MSIQDLTASLDLKQNLNIYATCKQLDTLNLILSIYDNSVQADLTDYDVRLVAMKADTIPYIQQHTQITINNNIVTITANEQLTTTSGKTLIELQFINKITGARKATFNLALMVNPSTLEVDGTISTATYTLLQELENKLDQATNYFNSVEAFQGAHPEILNLDSRVTQNTADLSEKADNTIIQSKVKSSTLYNAALKDIDLKYNLTNCKNAIKNGTLKIAFVGDSITEGANNLLQDIWVERFINKLKKDLPNITIQYTNFALGGRNTSTFVNSNYKAANPETDIAQNFWRSWSTVGKSWIDHVKDYAPNLLVYAFGVNDAGGIPDTTFYSNVTNAISYIKTTNTNMDVCMVTNLIASQNKEVWNQDEQELLNIARISREMSKSNNYALIDANRLWRILLYGREDEKFINNKLTDIISINNETSYNFDLNVNFSNPNYPALGSCDIKIRRYGTKHLIIRFAMLNDVNIIQLYNNQGSLLKTWNNCPQNVSVTVEGAKITVNNESFYCYQILYNGTVDFSAMNSYISSITFINRISFSETPVYTELDILGAVTNPIGQDINGNGINHPNSLGYYLTYYIASIPLINSLVNSKNDSTPISVTGGAINLFQTEGTYYIYNATDAPTGASPSGYVEVHKMPQTDIYITQKYYPYDDISTFYLRKYTHNVGWSSWYKYSGVVV